MKNLLFCFLIIPSFALGYGVFNAWWQFIPSTILIIGLTNLFFPKHWTKYIGLRVTKSELIGAAFLCLLFSLIAKFMILWSLPKEYSLVLGHDGCGYMTLLTILFQSLNEEMLFRGLLIQLLLYLRVQHWKIIIFPALIFCLAHWIFYNFSLSESNKGTLNLGSLVTLFLFGISAAMIYLRSRNILMPWALHAAWNFNRFSLVEIGKPYGKINEALSFNILEGALPVVFLSFVLVFASYLFYQATKSV